LATWDVFWIVVQDPIMQSIKASKSSPLCIWFEYVIFKIINTDSTIVRCKSCLGTPRLGIGLISLSSPCTQLLKQETY
jgi:hypothetical protein